MYVGGISPVIGLEPISLEQSIFGGRPRKSRSFQELRLSEEVVVEASEEVRATNLRRRISSVEDLFSLASLHQSEKTQVSMISSKSHGLVAETENGEQKVEVHSDQFNGTATSRVISSPQVKDGTLGPSSVGIDAQEEDRGAPPASVYFAEGQGEPIAGISVISSLIERGPGPVSVFSSVSHPAADLMGPRTSIDGLHLIGISPTASQASSPRSQLSFDLATATTSTILHDERRSSCDMAPACGHLMQGAAAVELFYRLNHARQTVDYVKRQASAFSSLSRATMDVWEGLTLLNSLREYEAALVGAEGLEPDMMLVEHALQTAEACRLAFPQHDWAGIVGLIHGLGKLLAHANFGAEPQWAVCGESFPVGCRFHPAVIHSQYFQANPDRRRRGFASATGMYQPGCGLANVCMSWSAAEYLYMVLARNRTGLPPEALFLIRYQKFMALLRPGQPYAELLSAFDRSMLPMLERFQQLAAYRRIDIPNRLQGQELRDHYDALLKKYIPQGKLRW